MSRIHRGFLLLLRLVTGATSGIGYHLAELFARDRYGLILVARTQSDLERVASEFKEKYQCPQVITIATDLSKVGAARELFREIKDRYQLKIDFLVNNAGVGLRGKVWETDLSRDVDIIELNIISLVALTKLFLPEMIERNEGRILMLGSVASFQPFPMMACYGATKAFIGSYTDALIEELKETKVTATLLVPGITATVRGPLNRSNRKRYRNVLFRIFSTRRTPVRRRRARLSPLMIQPM